MDDYYKRSGQIPAFGDWDYANELPITQYFECARQAGLIRFSSSSGESADAYVRSADLYAVNHLNKPKPSRKQQAATTRVGTREKRGQRAHVMEQKKQQAKVCDVTQPPTKHYEYQVQQSNRTRSNDAVPRVPPRFPTRPPKPVDEDLYKIPPELLHKNKRKKMLGLLCCLVPACAS
ncbi:hypothetical protein PRUPE_6G355600 [Prunus persica]|uniref:RIN4 pathogenic type III effector avirulence factor Avr cleavage site domain-containing protein n=1 Tax=Prunus persica TaxID=3760 RepID=A0A251P0K2_PRUPE|nr:uncharacterized protein LOC18772150 isoform X2 [Prunus persica]ONI05082.1 hypothetical protein PRUPE_6G355600 [Prunus persica]